MHLLQWERWTEGFTVARPRGGDDTVHVGRGEKDLRLHCSASVGNGCQCT